VANSQYLAVQFDRSHKIPAKLIAADPQKDVALLSVNMAALPNASPAPLYRGGAGKTPVQEGERVFTIGSPLSLDKIITTGIVSKVEPHTSCRTSTLTREIPAVRCSTPRARSSD